MKLDQLLQRFEIAQLTKEPTNCFGSALYLIGIRERDYEICYENISEARELDRLLEDFEEVQSPEIGCLVVWEFKETKSPVHMGVISKLNPLMLMNRTGNYQHKSRRNCALKIEQFSKVDETYRPTGDNICVRYLIKR